jgi:NAD(P)-dependent dehydrogenase (short-subunit alcohol dehydrogenase family)
VSRVADCEQLIASAVATYGQVDILVNNAGPMGRPAVVESHTAMEAS